MHMIHSTVKLLEENFDVSTHDRDEASFLNLKANCCGVGENVGERENFLKNYAHDADETDSSKDYEPNSDVLAHHLDEANSRVSADDTVSKYTHYYEKRKKENYKKCRSVFIPRNCG